MSENAAAIASDALRDALESVYLRAIEQGLKPAEALAVVLSWAAEEAARILADAL